MYGKKNDQGDYTEIYDNTSKCTNSHIYIDNPPEIPTIESPEDEHVFYFFGSQGLHTPEFRWKKVKNWGWVCFGDNAKKYYELKIKSEESYYESTSINDDYYKDEIITYSHHENLADGKYKFTINSKLDEIRSSISSRYFHICTVGDISPITLISPAENEYLTNNIITLIWEEPTFEFICGNISLYNYTVTIYKRGVPIASTVVEKGKNTATLRVEEVGDYTWDVVAYEPLDFYNVSEKRDFTFCIPKKSNSPLSLKKNKKDDSCTKEEPYTFYWEKPKDTGISCHGQKTNITKYKIRIRSSTLFHEKELTDVKDKMEYQINISCKDDSYIVEVWAWNDFNYSDPAVLKFDVCKKRAPEGITIGEVISDHCSQVTKISWSLSSLGKYCTESEDENKFLFTFTKGNETKLDTVSYQENGTFNRDFILDRNEWKVEIVAASKNGLMSAPATKTFTGSGITAIKNRTAEVIESNITFYWETEESFLECNIGDFKYILEYTGKTKGSKELSVNQFNNYTIPRVPGKVRWCIKLVSKGIDIINDCETFDVDENCVEVQPSWDDPDNALVSPVGSVVGDVLFKWNPATPGFACINESEMDGKSTRDVNEGDKIYEGYTVVVINDEDKNKKWEENTTAAEHVMEISETGYHTWYVVAFIGNVTSKPTKNMTFCHVSSPKIPKLKKYDPYEPNIVSWEEVECKYRHLTD